MLDVFLLCSSVQQAQLDGEEAADMWKVRQDGHGWQRSG